MYSTVLVRRDYVQHGVYVYGIIYSNPRLWEESWSSRVSKLSPRRSLPRLAMSDQPKLQNAVIVDMDGVALTSVKGCGAINRFCFHGCLLSVIQSSKWWQRGGIKFLGNRAVCHVVLQLAI